MAQIGLYAHPCQDSRTLAQSCGQLTPDTPPPDRLIVDRPEGSAEEFDKVFLKTSFGVLLLTWVRSLALVYVSLVKGPHRNAA